MCTKIIYREKTIEIQMKKWVEFEEKMLIIMWKSGNKNPWMLRFPLLPEVVIWRCSVKKLFLKMS